MKKVKIYAPFSGKVSKIEAISDDAFASKSLGDGFFIVPEDNVMQSIVEYGKIKLIAETKHAVFFETDNLLFLVHIGMDTVNLNGKPFNVKKAIGDIVNKNSKILEFDKEKMPKQIDLSTPVLLDTSNIEKYHINYKNIDKVVKRGDLICEIEYDLKDSTSEEIIQMKEEENKYKVIAQNIVQAIGGKKNQLDTYNCMTRLRFRIIDKSKVNENEIKKISAVKGINWKGEELQIIIGGEVYKIKQECTDLYDQTDEKTKVVEKVPFKKKIAPALTSILFPTIPLLIGTGIIAGIQAILVVSGVLQNPNPSTGLGVNDLDVFSALFYIASKVGIELIGVAFLYSTVKYLRGETTMALLLALLLTSRYLFGTSWILFYVFGNPIAIKSYESSVLPMIAAGFLIHYLNVWTKKWMPTAIDVVFRTAFVVFVSFICIMFTIGPFFGIIEQFISKFVILLGEIPLGLGLGIFAMMWQTLVLTGTHVAVVTAITLPMTNEGLPSVMYSALQIAIVAQIGAAIAVSIRTKNSKIRQTAIAGIPSAIFGITEPLIYGVNLRKFSPFIYASLGALAGGIFGGIFGLEQIQRTGTGIMSYLGLGIGKNLVIGLLASSIALTSAFTITFILYIDRKSEIKEIKKVNKFVKKVLLQNSNVDKKSITSMNIEMKKIYDEMKKTEIYKDYESRIVLLSNKEIKLQKWNDSFAKQKNKMYEQAIKYIQDDKDKYNLLAKKYNNFVKGEKFKNIENEILILNEEVLLLQKKYSNYNEETIKKFLKAIGNGNFIIDKIIYDIISNKYKNALNVLELNYEMVEEKEIDYRLIKDFFKGNKGVLLNEK